VDSKPKTLGTSFLRGKLRAAGWAEVTSCILGVVENGVEKMQQQQQQHLKQIKHWGTNFPWPQ